MIPVSKFDIFNIFDMLFCIDCSSGGIQFTVIGCSDLIACDTLLECNTIFN